MAAATLTAAAGVDDGVDDGVYDGDYNGFNYV